MDADQVVELANSIGELIDGMDAEDATMALAAVVGSRLMQSTNFAESVERFCDAVLQCGDEAVH